MQNPPLRGGLTENLALGGVGGIFFKLASPQLIFKLFRLILIFLGSETKHL